MDAALNQGTEHLPPQRDPRYHRRLLKGPLPKDYELPYPYPLNVNHLDARQFGPQVWAGLYGWLRFGYLSFAVATGAFAFVALTFLLLLPWSDPINILAPLGFPIPFALLGLLCYWGFKRRGFVPSRIVFDREHGEVLFRARGRRPERRYPFAWAQGYMGSITTRSGLQHKLLEIQIIDPSSGKTLERLTGGIGPTVKDYDVLALWSFLCQYMDKQRPLPAKAELLDVALEQRFGGLPHLLPPDSPENQFGHRLLCELCVQMEAISFSMDYLGIEYANPFDPSHPYPENAARVRQLREQYERTTQAVLSAIA